MRKRDCVIRRLIFKGYVNTREERNTFCKHFRKQTNAVKSQDIADNRISCTLLCSLLLLWLGWKDLNPRNNGVRVRCLTAWRHPSDSAVFRRLNYYITIHGICKAPFEGFLNFFCFSQIGLAFSAEIWYNADVRAVVTIPFQPVISDPRSDPEPEVTETICRTAARRTRLRRQFKHMRLTP